MQYLIQYFISRDRGSWVRFSTLGLILLCVGCAITSGPRIQYNQFMYPTPVKNVTVPISEPLMVYRFLMAESEDTRSLVISKGDGEDRVVPDQRWEQNPADMITDLLRRDLEGSGLFVKAVDQFSSTFYRYALEGMIHKLRGVIRDGKALGVVDVTVSLIDFESPIGSDKAILKKRYKIEEPCKDSTAGEIFQSLNRGVRDLSARVRSDIRSVLKKQKPEPPNQSDKKLRASRATGTGKHDVTGV